MHPQTVQVDYATFPARNGVTLEHGPGWVRMTFPPDWRRLLLTTPFVFCLLVQLPMATRSGDALVLLICALSLLMFGVVGLHAVRNSRERSIVELNGEHLLLSRNLLAGPVDDRPAEPPDADAAVNLRIPRAHICQIHYASHSRMVVIRLHGLEMIEIQPMNDPRVLKWVAGQLAQVLTPSRATPVVPIDTPCDASDPPTPAGQERS